jgi:hypothetical protein
MSVNVPPMSTATRTELVSAPEAGTMPSRSTLIDHLVN